MGFPILVRWHIYIESRPRIIMPKLLRRCNYVQSKLMLQLTYLLQLAEGRDNHQHRGPLVLYGAGWQTRVRDAGKDRHFQGHWAYHGGKRGKKKTTWAPSQYKDRLSHLCMGIPMLKIRRSRDRLIFNMGIPVLVRRLYIETPPGSHFNNNNNNSNNVTFI